MHYRFFLICVINLLFVDINNDKLMTQDRATSSEHIYPSKDQSSIVSYF